MDFEKELRQMSKKSGFKNDPKEMAPGLDPVDFSKINLKPYNKNFYVENQRKDKEIIDEYRKKHHISICHAP